MQRPRLLAFAVAFLVFMIPLGNVHAIQTINVDLASDEKVSHIVIKGEQVHIILFNTIPGIEYTLVRTGYKEEKSSPLPAPPGLTISGGTPKHFAPQKVTCTEKNVANLSENLTQITFISEVQVADFRKRIDTELIRLTDEARKACGKEVTTLENYLLKSPGSFLSTPPTAPGTTTYTIRRMLSMATPPAKSWQVEFTTPSRGEWSVGFGYAFLPNRDHKYFSQQVAADTYVVTRQADDDSWNYTPIVTYSWQPSPQWCFGERDSVNCSIMGGLGLDLTNPTVLLGVNVTFAENLSLSAGGAFEKQTRLAGQYTEGQILSQSIDSENLVKEVYRPNLFFALTFRFGSNPFSAEKAPRAGTE